MCIRIGYSQEQLHAARVEAQQEVINALHRTLSHGTSHPDARRILHDALARPHTNPVQWAINSAETLVQLVARFQTQARENDLTIQSLRLRCKQLQKLLDRYHQDPLQDQVQALAQERDHWQAEATRLANRVRSLEQALSRAQQAHQSEVAALQQTIAHLNRIIVAQQEQLNARLE